MPMSFMYKSVEIEMNPLIHNEYNYIINFINRHVYCIYNNEWYIILAVPIVYDVCISNQVYMYMSNVIYS